jgi:hypothetical protein
MKKWLKIIGWVIVAVPLVGFGTFMIVWYLLSGLMLFSFDASKIPYDLVTASPMEFDKINTISKFRSGAGHDYTQGAWDNETCRSMKHYFWVGRSDLNRIRSLPTPDNPNVKILAPFDGTVGRIEQGGPPGQGAFIRSKNFPNFYVRFGHIELLPSLHFGAQVTSGQQVGTIGPKDGLDVSIEALVLFKSIYLSPFDLMTDQAFAPFASAGYTRSDFIISREYRDTHPLKCGAGGKPQEFIYDANYNWHSDYIFLKPEPLENSDHRP